EIKAHFLRCRAAGFVVRGPEVVFQCGRVGSTPYCNAGTGIVRCENEEITMKTISSGMHVARQAVMFAVLMLALSSRANAAGIIFDFCTEPSVCNRLFFSTILQPGGEITSSVGSLDPFLKIVEIGINSSEAESDFHYGGPPSHPFTPLGAGEIGPYRLF